MDRSPNYARRLTESQRLRYAGQAGQASHLPLPSAAVQVTPAQHWRFQSGMVPFRHISDLGRGNSVTVDEVESLVQGSDMGQVYARKVLRVTRPQHLAEVLAELRTMKSLFHHHIVAIRHTYEEGSEGTFGIIMDPVAEGTLKEYLAAASDPSQSVSTANLEIWFGCLASGLAFIHQHRVRHEDIKPANILVKGNRVLYSDFGISKTFGGNGVAADAGGDLGMDTTMYCAPEVVAQQPRSRKSDVFSLGCILTEILTTLCGVSVQAFAEWRGPEGARAYHLDLDKMLRWILQLPERAGGSHHYCVAALVPDVALRITATDLTRWISCDRDYLRGWDGQRQCLCLGHSPVGPFYATSLEGPYPTPSGVSAEEPVSWRRACDLWITKTQWYQFHREHLPAHIGTQPPSQARFALIAPSDFYTEPDSRDTIMVWDTPENHMGDSDSM